MDVIFAWFSRDWAAIGGWSLFIGQTVLILTLMYRDKLVAGSRLDKAEKRHATDLLAEQGRTNRALTAAEVSAAALDKALEQVRLLTDSQSLFDYVLRELLPSSPKRGTQAATVGETETEGVPS